MTRLAPILAALVLAGCMTATASDKPTRATAKPITVKLIARAAQMPRGSTLTLDGAWGRLDYAGELTRVMNAQGLCLAIHPRGAMISAGVVVARVARCVSVPDRTAPIFGLHMAGYGDKIDMAASSAMFYTMRAPGCMAWYLARPEADGNRIVYVSWDFLERNCK